MFVKVHDWQQKHNRKTISKAVNDLLWKYFNEKEEYETGMAALGYELKKRKDTISSLENQIKHIELRHTQEVKRLKAEYGKKLKNRRDKDKIPKKS